MAEETPSSANDEPAAAPPRRRKSSEERNAEARAKLEPLAPGERPTAVTVAAVVAGLLAVSNIIGLIAGGKPESVSNSQAVVQLMLVTGILTACAVGMWRARYWAVMGFQTLLVLTFLASSIGLLVASSLFTALFCFAIALASGVLFWYLIRAMARIQMPEPPESKVLKEMREQREHELGAEADGD